jgi:hypothetical protein
MKLFTPNDLTTLLAPHPAPCISIFMPAHRRPPETQQNPVRLRNLLRSVEDLLRSRYNGQNAQKLLEPLAAYESPEFWRAERVGTTNPVAEGVAPTDGIAVFHAADFSGAYRVPLEVPELAVVADSFHVKPLLGYLQANRRYYVLALSQKHVALYAGTPFVLTPVSVRDLPQTLDEVLLRDVQEPTLTAHAGGGGARGEIFARQSTPEDAKQEDLAHFFRAVDNAIWPVLRDETAPLVLAGVKYHFPIYRSVTRYQHLAPEGVEGSADGAPLEDLHGRSWPIIRELFRRQESAALADYALLASRRQATTDVGEIGQAIIEGRVRLLLLAENASLRGRFERTTGEVTLAPTPEPTAEDDLLDDLAEGVLARGGEVLVLPAGSMPQGSRTAALMRW